MLCPADLSTLDDRLRADPRTAPALKAVDYILSSHPVWNHERDDLEGVACLAAAKTAARRPPPNDFGAYCFEAAENNCWEYMNTISEWSWSDIPEDRLNDRFSEAETHWRHSVALEEWLACCRDSTDREIVRMRTESARDDHIGDPLTLKEIGDRLRIDKATVSRRLARVARRYVERNS